MVQVHARLAGLPPHRTTEDVDLLPRHFNPRIIGRPVLAIDGGAQALGRTMHVKLVDHDKIVTIAVPDLLGALILKAAAAASDNRETERHLRDAALLSALITDHAEQRARLRGSDRQRLRSLAAKLSDEAHPAWLALPDNLALRGKDTLRILTA